jgi:hypothetical protein
MALKEVRLNHFQQTGEHMLELEKEIHCLKNLTHRVGPDTDPPLLEA